MLCDTKSEKNYKKMQSRGVSPQVRPVSSAISDLQNEMATSNETPVWNARHEVVLKEWAEQAICFQKMHEQSHRKYSRQNIQLTLPVIVMSTITGTANFSLASFSEEWRKTLPILIGAINITAGMITTIAQYLRVSEKSEGHRVAALAYGKMARNVGSELNLPRIERSTGGLPLVRACRNEMDRLEEQSPDIGADIVKLFEKAHHDVEMSRPSIVDIHPVTIYTSLDDGEAKEQVGNMVTHASAGMFQLGRASQEDITIEVELPGVSESGAVER